MRGVDYEGRKLRASFDRVEAAYGPWDEDHSVDPIEDQGVPEDVADKGTTPTNTVVKELIVTYHATLAYGDEKVEIPLASQDVSGLVKSIVESGALIKVSKWMNNKNLSGKVSFQDAYALAVEIHEGDTTIKIRFESETKKTLDTKNESIRGRKEEPVGWSFAHAVRDEIWAGAALIVPASPATKIRLVGGLLLMATTASGVAGPLAAIRAPITAVIRIRLISRQGLPPCLFSVDIFCLRKMASTCLKT